MTGLRFKVGELAIIGVCACYEAIGRMVEIVEVGPFKAGHVFRDGIATPFDTDYQVSLDGQHYICADWMLLKIEPPAELSSISCLEVVEA
jgi:hypothetical protein